MRLLDTQTLTIADFYDADIPRYAILSHRWGHVEQEVSYTDYMAGNKMSTSGRLKIMRFCAVAKARGFDHAWIDTSCIDKTSSAELSEAINSMYAWYQRAGTCFVYLADVDSATDLETSDWFNRGWTLQEMLAPSEVLFFDRRWNFIGTRSELSGRLSSRTGISEALLRHQKPLGAFSVAQIMSWAAGRRTSRWEDEAYSLLGLFNVHIPLLYGEGSDAFQRLQEAILAKGDDNSLFAWETLAPYVRSCSFTTNGDQMHDFNLSKQDIC